jgi:hypothetical protein
MQSDSFSTTDEQRSTQMETTAFAVEAASMHWRGTIALTLALALRRGSVLSTVSLAAANHRSVGGTARINALL